MKKYNDWDISDDYEQDFMACSDERHDDLLTYLIGISSNLYSNMSEEDKSFLSEVHSHLRECMICSDGYRFFKEISASNPLYADIFSPERFRLWRENEKYLDDLVSNRENDRK